MAVLRKKDIGVSGPNQKITNILPVSTVYIGKKMEKIIELCDRCGEMELKPLHTCPFLEEIDNNHKTLCNCCERCETQCYWDI